MTNNMLRLRRKQQKATARLSNFINKQTREDSNVDSSQTSEYRPEELPLNFLKNEQLNAPNVMNNKENIQQNINEKPQKDVLVDSSFSHEETSEALKINRKTLSDDENFSF